LLHQMQDFFSFCHIFPHKIAKIYSHVIHTEKIPMKTL
jgi:hypothetical protein